MACTNIRKRMQERRAKDKSVGRKWAKKSLEEGKNIGRVMLGVCSALALFGTLLIYIIGMSEISRYSTLLSAADVDTLKNFVLTHTLINGAVAAFFVSMFFLAKTKPYPACLAGLTAIIGLLVYGGIQGIGIMMMGLNVIIVLGLIFALQKMTKYRGLEPKPEAKPMKKPKMIWS